MKKAIIITTLLIGSYLVYEEVKKSKETTTAKKALLKAYPEFSNNSQMLLAFDKMTTSEITFLFDVVIVKKYGQPLPAEISQKTGLLFAKYGIIAT